ncbi:transposase [Burkholderia alba]|uniref:transposase n=1 Tax=Burkholderia alba TaxID=2683677 RepID=UPI00389913E9
MSNAGGRDHPRRAYAREFKQQMIREALEPGTSVSIVARRHDIHANVVFGWLKQYRDGKLDLPTVAAGPTAAANIELLPVDVIDSTLALRSLLSAAASKAATRDVPASTPGARSKWRSASAACGFVDCLPSTPKRSCEIA